MKQISPKYAKEILSLLKKHYPNAKMILQWSNNFELLIAIILSAQCTDLMVNKVTKRIFSKYRGNKKELENFYKFYEQINIPDKQRTEIVNFAFVPLRELEQDIKSTGFYRNKAKNIQEAAKVILNKFNGIIPKTIAELITIPGVGRKTANVFLGNAYHIFEGIAVDTHVRKQALLLGLTENTNPDKIEQDLMKLFNKKGWFSLTYLLIEHGRNMRKKKSDRINCGNKNCILCSEK